MNLDQSFDGWEVHALANINPDDEAELDWDIMDQLDPDSKSPVFVLVHPDRIGKRGAEVADLLRDLADTLDDGGLDGTQALPFG